MRLLLDASNLCHAARHTTGDLSAKDGTGTGIIYGVLSRALTLGELFKTNDLVWCWDGAGSIERRRALYPGYKASRRKEKTPEEMEEDRLARIQFDDLRQRILPILFPCAGIRGYEADDVIAQLALQSIDETVIVSCDKDFYQLLSRKMIRCIYNPTSKVAWTRERLMAEYRVSPAEWIYVKAIAGCDSDDVPGVPGVGDSTAVKYLLGELKETAKTYAAITAASEMIERNLKLVRLPFAGMKWIDLAPASMDLNKLMAIAQELDIASIFNGEEFSQRWDRFVRGEFHSRGGGAQERKINRQGMVDAMKAAKAAKAARRLL